MFVEWRVCGCKNEGECWCDETLLWRTEDEEKTEGKESEGKLFWQKVTTEKGFIISYGGYLGLDGMMRGKIKQRQDEEETYGLGCLMPFCFLFFLFSFLLADGPSPTTFSFSFPCFVGCQKANAGEKRKIKGK